MQFRQYFISRVTVLRGSTCLRRGPKTVSSAGPLARRERLWRSAGAIWVLCSANAGRWCGRVDEDLRSAPSTRSDVLAGIGQRAPSPMPVGAVCRVLWPSALWRWMRRVERRGYGWWPVRQGRSGTGRIREQSRKAGAPHRSHPTPAPARPADPSRTLEAAAPPGPGVLGPGLVDLLTRGAPDASAAAGQATEVARAISARGSRGWLQQGPWRVSSTPA